MKHLALLQPTQAGVYVPVELPAERRRFICGKNNAGNAFTCQWRRYHSITAAVLSSLPFFS